MTKPRLRVEMLDGAALADPRLRMTTELLTQPDDAQGERRRQAQAIWRALSLTVEGIELQADRIQQLAAQSERLQKEAQTARAEAAAWQARAAQAEGAQRREPWLWAGLLGLLVTAVGFAGLWWRRRSQATVPVWWLPPEPDRADAEPADANAVTVVDQRLSGTSGRPHEAAGASPSLAELADDAPTSVVHPAHSAQPGGSTGAPAAPRSRPDDEAAILPRVAPSTVEGLEPVEAVGAVKVDELLDVQEEAEFFMSLGQFDQAIAALHRHLAENPAASALVYLDLLDLYHRTGQHSAYEALREKFNLTFNAQIPAFEEYVATGAGLEAYPRAFSRIQALWPSPKVIAVIEESLFRAHGDESARFDIEAYKDLLLLYAVAKELARMESTSSRAADASPPAATAVEFQSTQIMPLAAEPAPMPDQSEGAVDTKVPPASANIGIDIDLSQWLASPGDDQVVVATSDGHDGRGNGSQRDAAPSNTIDFELFLPETNDEPGSAAQASGVPAAPRG